MSDLDRELLVDIAGGDMEAAELLRLFFSSAHDLVARLRAAADEGSEDGVNRASHQLAGAAGTCGFVRMEACFRGIETEAQDLKGPALAERIEAAAALLVSAETEAMIVFPSLGGGA